MFWGKNMSDCLNVSCRKIEPVFQTLKYNFAIHRWFIAACIKGEKSKICNCCTKPQQVALQFHCVEYLQYLEVSPIKLTENCMEMHAHFPASCRKILVNPGFLTAYKVARGAHYNILYLSISSWPYIFLSSYSQMSSHYHLSTALVLSCVLSPRAHN